MSVAPQLVVTTPTKSVGVAVILAGLFGPLGMFYATIPGALVMGVLALVIGIPFFGLPFLFLWPIGMAWAGIAASRFNKKLLASAQPAAPRVSSSP